MNYTLNVSQFRDLFYRNSDYENKYSYDALGIIFDWYEENEPDYDFDIGEVAGSWSDYDDLDDLERDFYYLIENDEDYEELEDEEEKIEYLTKEIERTKTVLTYNHGYSFVILD